MADGEEYRAQAEYTITPSYAIGISESYWRDEKWWLHAGTLTNLLRRWNFSDSQGNLYLKSGLGVATSDFGRFRQKAELAAFSGLAADWESRRYYLSYENEVLYAGDIARNFSQKARIGIAPYIGDYGDLHTWLMLQLDHRPWAGDPVTVTPLVRLFQETVLGEFGLSNHGDLMAHLMVLF
ncbi:MAG: hypothetical protein AB7G80_09695 [Dongiaceae bacterium]